MDVKDVFLYGILGGLFWFVIYTFFYIGIYCKAKSRFLKIKTTDMEELKAQYESGLAQIERDCKILEDTLSKHEISTSEFLN